MIFSSVRKKTIIFILTAMVVAVVLALVGLKIWAWHDGVEMYAGKIIKMDTNSFILVNKKGEETKIIISPETKILKGRQGISEMSLVGEQVFVVGALNGQNEIEARVVRIIKHK